MPDCMTFPKHWEEFIDNYSFVDEKHIYTNGARLISVLRVEQLIEHLLAQKDGAKVGDVNGKPIL